MRSFNKPYKRNGIPIMKLADKYYSDLNKFQMLFYWCDDPDLVIRVFDQLFESKYLKTNKKGERYWKI